MYKGLLTLLLLLAGLIFFAARSPGTLSEIERIKSLHTTAEQSLELTKLLERVGAIEAQEELFHSGLPFTGETHLLVHTIGNFIYEKYGAEGLSYCRDYFLSACYHAFILNTLAHSGMSGMANVMEYCALAPPGVAAQCAHGSGHGFVAWHDYNLVKALEMCDELGRSVQDFPYFNCYDGVFMENIWGVHDGAPSPKRWIKEADLNYPCDDPRIGEKYLGACWGNQATLVYQHYHGDLRQTALFCDTVGSLEYRTSCYNNFARQIHPLTQGQTLKALEMCGLATGNYWKNNCIMTIVSAAWSVGDRTMPYEICSSLVGPGQNECLMRIIGMINYHYRDLLPERTRYCDKITNATYREQCKK